MITILFRINLAAHICIHFTHTLTQPHTHTLTHSKAHDNLWQKWEQLDRLVQAFHFPSVLDAFEPFTEGAISQQQQHARLPRSHRHSRPPIASPSSSPPTLLPPGWPARAFWRHRTCACTTAAQMDRAVRNKWGCVRARVCA